jgi:hydroxyacylglutathione hydrolase
MKISNRVFMVGSGKSGMEMSHTLDCNIYLLDGGGQYALIDSGCGIESERIVWNIENLGVPMGKVSHLILTHAHGDHAAGARYFYERYGLKVAISNEAALWLEQGDLDKTSIKHAIGGNLYPADFQFLSCPVELKLFDNDTIQIGDVILTVVNSPGHSQGHISLFWEEEGEKSMLSGDVIFARGRVIIQSTWDCNIREYADTISKFQSLQIDSLYPGHGPFLRSNAKHHIEMANQYFKKLEIPPNY